MAVLAAGARRNTVSAASACSSQECWCNWTAAITPGWRTEAPNSPLLLAVDDATGTVVNAVFRTGEDTRGYFMLLEGLIESWGLSLALYSDRHAVFKHNARQPETAAEATQFTRGLQELGIRQIFARSPQAKGRVGAHGRDLSGPVGNRTAPS